MESKTMIQAALLGAVVLCGASFADAQTRMLPNPTPAARSYLCFEGSSAAEVMKKSNEAGARGWKMVSASSLGDRAIWCFEQLTTVRPMPNQ